MTLVCPRGEYLAMVTGRYYQRKPMNGYCNKKYSCKTWHFPSQRRHPLSICKLENALTIGHCITKSVSQPNLSCLSLQSEPQLNRARSLNYLDSGNEFSDPILLEKVGSGTYSVVYKCKLEANGPILAAKILKMNSLEGAPGTAIREASILKSLKNDNIITLHKILYKPGQLILVLEYIEDNLSKYIRKYNLPKDVATVERFSEHLFKGLKYLHEKNILHRDLKPENLLVTNNRILKIADFGMARQKLDPMCNLGKRVVTLWYKPPEILLDGCSYDFGVDIWSAGCIVFEMMNGEVLFEGSDPATQICKIFQVLGVPPPSYWPELRLNKTFQGIQGTLEKHCFTVEGTLETYNRPVCNLTDQNPQICKDRTRGCILQQSKSLSSFDKKMTLEGCPIASDTNLNKTRSVPELRALVSYRKPPVKANPPPPLPARLNSKGLKTPNNEKKPRSQFG
ncbi:Serine/threonine-protein kinase pef1 [Taenia crassiceps]|uniref:Cell division protein kinase 5 n=1 Tax=Taenia crassiceps TaxID=6207 RepID=A0ABR4QGP2_9CEST